MVPHVTIQKEPNEPGSFFADINSVTHLGEIYTALIQNNKTYDHDAYDWFATEGNLRGGNYRISIEYRKPSEEDENAKTYSPYLWSNYIANLQGTGNGAFSPDTTMTRGMIVTVLHRLESTPKGGSVSFGDVSADAYFAEAVAWGNENGIVKGDGKNFLPDDNVTREQLATFLYRYASKYNVDTTGRANLSSFPDSGSASIYAKDALEWAFHTGLIKGGDDGRLDPTGSATRAQVAAILKRFVEYINQ